MEEGGFLYDSDIYNDDIPYYAKSEDGTRKLLLIPYTPDANDFHFLSGRFGNAEEFFTYLRDTFDVMLSEGLKNPKIMNIGIHVRISGRAGRMRAMQRFLEYVSTKKSRVWVARRVDIANWLLKNYPA